MVEKIKKLICKWQGHDWKAAKRDNIYSTETIYVCKRCGETTVIQSRRQETTDDTKDIPLEKI